MDWVGVVRKMELLLMFSTIYEDVGRVAKLYIPSTLNIDLKYTGPSQGLKIWGGLVVLWWA